MFNTRLPSSLLSCELRAMSPETRCKLFKAIARLPNATYTPRETDVKNGSNIQKFYNGLGIYAQWAMRSAS